MLQTILLIVILTTVVASEGYPDAGSDENDYDSTLLNDDELVDYINSVGTTWTAKKNKLFSRVSDEEDMKVMLMSREYTDDLPNEEKKHLSETRFLKLDVPEYFDSRDEWGKKCPSLWEIRAQSKCGSCWAFGAVEVMTDRTCIHSEGRNQVRLSAVDLLSCCTECGDGCLGGSSYRGFEYWEETGIVSGGNYGDRSTCRPYPFSPKEKKTQVTPPCRRQCQSSYQSREYERDKHYGRSAFKVEQDVEAIQKEILTNGPVVASFDVFADFRMYSRGVYQHVKGDYVGGHAIKMLGWGVEKDVPYWICANSWNNDWGNHGFFLIRRGMNECGIEAGVTAGLPKVERRTEDGRFYRRQHQQVVEKTIKPSEDKKISPHISYYHISYYITLYSSSGAFSKSENYMLIVAGLAILRLLLLPVSVQ